MKIKSISDVITNSSSEVFCLHYPNVTAKELKKELEAIGEEGCSGMGGDIDIDLLEGSYQRDEAFSARIPWIPGSLIIGIDWAFKETIKYFRDHYPDSYNIDEKVIYPIYDSQGKDIQKLTTDYQKWKSLNDPLRMHGKWALNNIDWWNYENRGLY